MADRLRKAIAADTRELLTEGLDLTPRFKRDEIEEVTSENRLKVWLWLIQPALILKDSDPAPNETAEEALKRREEDKAHGVEFRMFLAQARQVFFHKARELENDATPPNDHTIFAIPALDTLLHDNAAFLKSIGLDPAALLDAVAGGWEAGRIGWPAFFWALQKGGSRVILDSKVDTAWANELGVIFQPEGSLQSVNSKAGYPPVEVHSVRTTRRAGPDGQDVRQLVIEVTQQRRGYYDLDAQSLADTGRPLGSMTLKPLKAKWTPGEFTFRGGATLILDLQDWSVRYIIRKRISGSDRLDRQRKFLATATDMSFTYTRGRSDEPFALMHRY